MGSSGQQNAKASTVEMLHIHPLGQSSLLGTLPQDIFGSAGTRFSHTENLDHMKEYNSPISR